MVGTPVDVKLVKIVMLELGEGSCGLIEVVGANTILVDFDIEVELIDCGMTVVGTVEVVIGVVEGGIVVGKIVVNGIIVDVGLEIKVVEGSEVSHNWYSQYIENGPASITNTCNNINSKYLMIK